MRVRKEFNDSLDLGKSLPRENVDAGEGKVKNPMNDLDDKDEERDES